MPLQYVCSERAEIVMKRLYRVMRLFVLKQLMGDTFTVDVVVE